MRRHQKGLVRGACSVLAAGLCVAGFSGCEMQQPRRVSTASLAVPVSPVQTQLAGAARPKAAAQTAVAVRKTIPAPVVVVPRVATAALSTQASHGQPWQALPGAIYAAPPTAAKPAPAAIVANTAAAPKAVQGVVAGTKQQAPIAAVAAVVATSTVTASQAVSLKPQQLDQDNHAGQWRAFGDVEAEAVRYAGGRCSADTYRIAWAAADLFRVPPEFVAALIEIESGCRSDAVSVAGARGLMQLVPASGAREGYRFMHGTDRKPTLAELRDPATNIQLGVAYLGALQDHFSYIDAPMTRLIFVIAAYNCGPDFIDQRLPPEARTWETEQAAHWVRHSTPMETRAFVDAVVGKATLYSSAAMSARTRTVASSRSFSP